MKTTIGDIEKSFTSLRGIQDEDCPSSLLDDCMEGLISQFAVATGQEFTSASDQLESAARAILPRSDPLHA